MDRTTTRRGFLTAALTGGLAGVATRSVMPRAASAAAGDPVDQGANNDAGTTETILRSDPSGDKAALAVLNETGAIGAGTLPDGLRVFTTGTQGAAVQAFGGPGTFAKAPFDGIGVRARGQRAAIVAESLAGSNVPAAGVTGRTTTGATQPSDRVIGVWGVDPQNAPYGEGVLGESPAGIGRGVTGLSGYTESDSAILGSGPPGTGVWGVGTASGVHGDVSEPGGSAVRGDSNGVGAAGGIGGYFQGSTGVSAFSGDPDGVAVLAQTNPEVPGGVGLEVRGRTKYQDAGKATIQSGDTSIDVDVDNVDGAIVLATLQTPAQGTSVRNAIRVDDSQIRIRLTRRAPKNVVVGWMVVYPVT